MIAKNKTTVSNELEKQLLSRGFSKIIGIDEVGRGAFAGPVYVAGFVYSVKTPYIGGVKDSKKLSRKYREELFSQLSNLDYVVKTGSVDSINRIGIGKTIETLISEIILEQNNSDTYFLVDGYFKTAFGISNNISQIKHGDNLHYSISCASIIAKVLRDEYMTKLATLYPHYNFDKNVGYGTATHINALKTYGICNEHRRSFRPILQLSILNEHPQPGQKS